MKLALWILAISLAASALSLWLIGFPGICGFTGMYGDRLASTSVGLVTAIALFFLPVLGILAGILSVLLAGIRNLLRRSDRSRTAL